MFQFQVSPSKPVAPAHVTVTGQKHSTAGVDLSRACKCQDRRQCPCQCHGRR